ncbi:MAG: tetratricopeptide repeat protein, partial [Desulfobacterales bacterium]
MKRETVWLIAVVCLVAGFVGGVVFGVYKSGSVQAVAHPEAEGGMPPGAPGGGPSDADSRRMITELKAKLEKEPQNFEALTHLAHLYFDTGQVEQAIDAYTRVLEQDKQNPDIWTDLGVMYRRSKQPQKAIDAFKEAIDLSPEHEIARYN